jgi:hypothetical protein
VLSAGRACGRQAPGLALVGVYKSRPCMFTNMASGKHKSLRSKNERALIYTEIEIEGRGGELRTEFKRIRLSLTLS